MLVDQFEEVFTLCRSQTERTDFIELIATARARVVIAVRSDFYGRCAEFASLALALRPSTLLLGPMTSEQLRQAIVGPATAERLIVERELTARILADVEGEPGGLPLMSHALLEVWHRRRGRTMTVAAYEEIGGVRGAIAHTARPCSPASTTYGADRPHAAVAARHAGRRYRGHRSPGRPQRTDRHGGTGPRGAGAGTPAESASVDRRLRHGEPGP
ncbi:hypothetical protein SCALM49S_08916 [Streptomyces californicus]